MITLKIEENLKSKNTKKQTVAILTRKLYDAYDEIISLKQMFSKFSVQDINQCAEMGKQIISLQLQLDKHKSQNEMKNRESSFTRTIGKDNHFCKYFDIEKVASEISSCDEIKSRCSTPNNLGSSKHTRNLYNYSSENILKDDSLTEFKFQRNFETDQVKKTERPPRMPKDINISNDAKDQIRGRKGNLIKSNYFDSTKR